MFVTAYHTYIRTRPTTPTFIFSSGGKRKKKPKLGEQKNWLLWGVFFLLRTGMEPRNTSPAYKRKRCRKESTVTNGLCVFFLLELIALLVELFLGLVSVGGVQLIKGGCSGRTSRGSWFLCGANCRRMETDLGIPREPPSKLVTHTRGLKF